MINAFSSFARAFALRTGAVVAAFGSVYALFLILIIAQDQTVADPITRHVSFAPWWALFGSFDLVLVSGFSLAAIGFAWLARHLYCRAFVLPGCKPNLD